MNGSLRGAALSMAERFISEALVIPVVSTGASGGARLRVPDEYKDKLGELQKAAQVTTKSLGMIERAGELVDHCLNNKSSDDIWYTTFDGSGRTIILANAEVYRMLPEREIAEQVHKSVVESAVRRGEDIPEELLMYYRSKAQPVLPRAHA